MFMSIALAALAAAQAAAPQTSSMWVPLKTAQPAQVEQQAPAQPVATPVAATKTAPSEAPTATSETSPVAANTPAASSIRKAFVLWRNIEDGMSVGQLHALYPQGPDVAWHDDRTVLTNVPIIEGCQAKVNIMHPSGVVKEIVMRGDGAIAGRCSLKLITALSGKYGEPLDKDKVHGSLFGREGKNYIWAHDGITLQLKRYTSGALGGGGLFSASWELRYSTTDTKIDL